MQASCNKACSHYYDVIMGEIASQITSIAIVNSIVFSHADQRKHQSSVSLVFVRGIHRRPVNSPHKWPVRRKMFPFNDVIMGENSHSSVLLIIQHRTLQLMAVWRIYLHMAHWLLLLAIDSVPEVRVVDITKLLNQCQYVVSRESFEN